MFCQHGLALSYCCYSHRAYYHDGHVDMAAGGGGGGEVEVAVVPLVVDKSAAG